MFIDRAFDEIAKKNKVVIGFDLRDDYSQISYCRAEQSMPDTFSLVMGEEQYNIPTILCRKFSDESESVWLIGKDALRAASVGEGILIENLVTLAKNNENSKLQEDEFEANYLLEIFIKKALSKVSAYLGTDEIGAITFTLNDMNPQIMEVLRNIMYNIKGKKTEVYFLSNEDCFFQYIIHQPEEMWIHDVILYDYRNEGVKSQILQTNRKTSPVACFVETNNFPQMKMPDIIETDDSAKEVLYRQLDEKLLEIVQQQCEDRYISSIFLLGDNFSKHWCKESLKYMCKSRRVFQGNNLFSKGACYGARERLFPSTLSKSYVYLSDEKLKSNIGMKCNKGQEEIYFPILDAGINWYDAKKEFDVMLVKNNIITLTISPLDGGNTKIASISLDGLKVRGNKTNRVGLKFFMNAPNILEIEIKDKGFGEIFPSTGQVWKESLKLEFFN